MPWSTWNSERRRTQRRDDFRVLNPDGRDSGALCVCLTKAGTRCKNRPVSEGVFCYVHERQGCAKQVGEIPPGGTAPSPPRRAASPRRSSLPSRPTVQGADIAYFDQLDDTTVELICDKLAEQDDYRSLGRLVGSGKRFKTLCQPALDKLDQPPTSVDEWGNMTWKDPEGRLHRSGDKPARIWPDGTQEWWWHGRPHREGDQPATIYPGGGSEWHWHGPLHRDGDQPAVIYDDGTRKWFQHGQLHREGDQPAVIWANETREFFWHGMRHREGDQPARIRADGTQEWWLNGQLHREGDQPAVILADGSRMWFRRGKRIR